MDNLKDLDEFDKYYDNNEFLGYINNDTSKIKLLYSLSKIISLSCLTICSIFLF